MYINMFFICNQLSKKGDADEHYLREETNYQQYRAGQVI